MQNKYWTIIDNPKIKTSEYLDMFRKLLGEDKVYSYLTNDELDKLCPPPSEIEYTKFIASIEPDKEHLNKSYNDFSEETDKKFMTARQGIILNLTVYQITGERLDVRGITRTSTLDSDGRVLMMRRDVVGRFRLGWGNRDNRDVDVGPRQQFPLFPLSFDPETLKIGEMIYNKQEVEEALKNIKPL